MDGSVLVVEDEHLLRFDLAESLREAGFMVVEAGQASDALLVLQGNVARVDLLLTDIQMPGEMNGIDLLHWAREHRPDVVRAVISGAVQWLDAARGLCTDELIFTKPAELPEIIAAVRAATRSRGDEPEADAEVA